MIPKFNANMTILLMGTLILNSCNNLDKEYKEVAYYSFNGDELVRPQNYRSWIYAGTPLTPNDMNNGKAPVPEFHNVYIDPISFDYYKEHGKWKEGTILVAELVSVGTKATSSGNGYFMGKFIGLQAAVKSKEHFPNEPGNWAYFSFSNPEGGNLGETGVAFPTNRCNACHAANAEDDFVFTLQYPVLGAAKHVGIDVVPENLPAR